ncbi:MAG: NADH-quinone oxidoreductase subunit C [Calditrichaeota bacterium]|nr:NADH-quinone oxidoreductase subunit C [Calditrichota bacterium]MCB0312623.1 NADH-quinone oxidoreductase subunit C [Calditrichota bacterium]
MSKYTNDTIKERISGKFPEAQFEAHQGQLACIIAKEKFLPLAQFLKKDKTLSFDYLTDMTGVDYLKMDREPRFDLVLHLFSFKINLRLRVKVGVGEDDMDVPSMTQVWKAAHWLEREAFEMFGFNFTGHPDLRRLLLPDIFDGYPMRKDYPLRGRGERDVILDMK